MTTASPSRPHAAAPPAPPSDDLAFTVDVSLDAGLAQRVDFGLPGVPPLLVDEPPPLGELTGPNPARVLAAALATCLGASLLFCLRKGHVDVHGLHTRAEGALARNERGRLRVSSVRVRLEPEIPADEHARATRCLALFEDYCVVTATVRAALPVEVEVALRAPVTVG